MDSSTGMLLTESDLALKLSYDSETRLKLQKVDKVYVYMHKTPKLWRQQISKIFYGKLRQLDNWDIAHKNGFHYHNLVFMQNLMLLIPHTSGWVYWNY